MKVAVVGAGAIGLYYGAKLAQAGAEVRFLLRSDLAAVRARGSILARDRQGAIELRPPPIAASTEEIGQVDLVIVTLKSTSNAALPGLLPPLLGPATAILTLQNGLGPDEFLAGHFGAGRIVGGLAYICCNRTGPGEVVCVYSDAVAFGEFRGPPTDRTRAIAGLFRQAGIGTRLAENLDQARWEKLVWNVPFNGLTIAAGEIGTDRVCADPALTEEAIGLMREIQAAAGRLGHVISDEFVRQRYAVTPPMGAYRPSSLVDYSNGREVEVESIWGEPLRRGRAAGAAMPRLALLYALLRNMVAVHTYA